MKFRIRPLLFSPIGVAALLCLAPAGFLRADSNFVWSSAATNLSVWSAAGNWTSSTEVPGTNSGSSVDTVLFNQDFSGATFTSVVDYTTVIRALTVTDTVTSSAADVVLGSTGTNRIVFSGTNVVITSALNSGRTVSLNGELQETSGVFLRKAGGSHLDISLAGSRASNFFAATGNGGGFVLEGAGNLTLRITNTPPTFTADLASITRTDAAAHNVTLRLRGNQNTVLNFTGQSTAGGSFLFDGATINVMTNAYLRATTLQIGTGNGGGLSTAFLNWYSTNGLNGVGAVLIGDQNFGGNSRLIMKEGVLIVTNNVQLGGFAQNPPRNGNAFVDVEGGYLRVGGNLLVASSTTSNQNDTVTGVVTITNTGVLDVKGSVVLGNATGDASFSGRGQATLNLDGGALILTNSIITANSTVENSNASNRGIFNWNGGSVIVTNNNIAELFRLTNANDRVYVKNGGAILDTTNWTVGISQALLHDPGLVGTDGGFTKKGSGMVVFSGTNTYNGRTLIENGTLQVGAGGTTGNVGAGVITNFGTLAINRSDSLDWTNLVTGSGAFRKFNTNTVTLLANLNYSGSTLVSTGILQVGNGGTVGNIGTGNLTNTATVVYNRSDNVTWSNVIAGNGTLVKQGSGTLTLAGASVNTGVTRLETGTVVLASGDNRLGTGSSVQFAGSSTLDLGGNSQTLTDLTVVFTNGLVVITNGNLRIQGNNNLFLRPSAGLASNTASKVDMSGLGSFTYNSPTRTMYVGVADARSNAMDVSLASGSNLVIATRLELAAGGDGTVPFNSGILRLGATNVFHLGNGSNTAVQISGYRSDDNVITFQPGIVNGSVRLRASNGVDRLGTIIVAEASSGVNTLISGRFDLGNADVLVDTVILGRTVQLGNGAQSEGFMTMTGGLFDAATLKLGQITAVATNPALNLGILSGKFTQSGGTARLTNLFLGSADYAGTATGANTPILQSTYELLGGTLAASVIQVDMTNGGFRNTSTRIINFGSGTLQNYNNGVETNDLVISGVGGAGGRIDIQLNTASNHIFRADAGRSIVLSNHVVVSGSGPLQKTGAGDLIFAATNVNTFSGPLTISEGSVQVGNGGTGGSLGTGVVTNNAALAFNRSDTLLVNNLISGTGSVFQSGSGTTIFTADHDYSGDTIITNGTLQIGNGGTTGAFGTGDVYNDATLAFNRSDDITFTNAIFGAGALRQLGAGLVTLAANYGYGATIIESGRSLKVGNGGTVGTLGNGRVTNNGSLLVDRSDAVTLGNQISGTGTFQQIGTGTTTLTNNNTYTGDTIVSNGTLLVENVASLVDSATGSGTVRVLTNGTLGGSGSIGGAAIIDGRLAPGSSPGVLTFNSNLTFNTTAELVIEINGTNVGTEYDQVLLGTAGILTFNGSPTLTLNDTVALSGSYVLEIIKGFGSMGGTFGGLLDGATITTGLNQFVINYGTLAGYGDSVTLTAVPEPGSAAALAGALGLLLRRRRRR